LSTAKLRPGIVHRLDKDTSGVMIVAKNMMSYEDLKDKFKKHQIIKKYIALCFGVPKNKSGVINNYIGRDRINRKFMTETSCAIGKRAVTRYGVINTFEYNDDMLSLIEFELQTGRMHQIRVHAKFFGVPLIGDNKYFTKDSKALSKSLGAKRQLLHSHSQ
jgi:23S rRNA pseudouridine1911/1915/1917 synthase